MSLTNLSRPRATAGAALVITIASVLILVALQGTSAQVAFSTGQNIAPVYEGWEQHPDGTINLVFGYFNRNWDEEINVPIGPDNTIAPGEPDQGQPTHFLPRRNRFLFRIRVPKDFGNKELIWTLTSHGKTERAYGTLKPDYFIDEVVLQNNIGSGGGSSRGNSLENLAPVLKVESEKNRYAKVGEPVTLTAVATDDGKPKPRAMPPPLLRLGRTGRGTPDSASGLRLSWFVYRGAGRVTFDPPQIKVWEDDRDGQNSPWSAGWATPPTPPGGRWIVWATFSEPGTYLLRCLAHDGGLSASEDVTFVVDR